MTKTIELKLYAVKSVGGWTLRSIRRMKFVEDVRLLGSGNVIQSCPTCRDRKLCNRFITTVRIAISDSTSDDETYRLIADAQYTLFRYLHRAEREESSITVTHGISCQAKPAL